MFLLCPLYALSSEGYPSIDIQLENGQYLNFSSGAFFDKVEEGYRRELGKSAVMVFANGPVEDKKIFDSDEVYPKIWYLADDFSLYQIKAGYVTDRKWMAFFSLESMIRYVFGAKEMFGHSIVRAYKSELDRIAQEMFSCSFDEWKNGTSSK